MMTGGFYYKQEVIDQFIKKQTRKTNVQRVRDSMVCRLSDAIEEFLPDTPNIKRNELAEMVSEVILKNL